MKDIVKKMIDKKFDTTINGYNPSHVDAFIDTIIKEFEAFDKDVNNEIETLKYKNEELNNKNNESLQKIKTLESEVRKLKKELKTSNE